MRPFFPFYGSKWNIARYYPVPTHDVVIEPFAGSAGYSTFYDCPRVRLFDADPILAGVWQYLIKVAPTEIMALPELHDVGDSVDNYDIPQEARWLIGFWLNRGSASPKKSRTAYSARTDKGQLNWGMRAKWRIASQVEAIRGWEAFHAPYSEAPAVAATWFVDPPYTDKGRYYRVRFDDFRRLAAWCWGRQGQVIACEGEGAQWLPFRPLGDFKSSLGKAKECIFTREVAANGG